MNRRKREREMRWLISWVYTGGAEKRERERVKTVVVYQSTTMTTTNGKRRTYELLSKQKSSNATEKHYCSSEIEVSKY